MPRQRMHPPRPHRFNDACSDTALGPCLPVGARSASHGHLAAGWNVSVSHYRSETVCSMPTVV